MTEEKILEIHNLNNYYIAHIMSADFESSTDEQSFNIYKRWCLKLYLNEKYPNYLDTWNKNKLVGDCLLVDKVFNLIVKDTVSSEYTHTNLTVALEKMRNMCIIKNIKKIAMPITGYDPLTYESIKNTVNYIFYGTDIEIIFCTK